MPVIELHKAQNLDDILNLFKTESSTTFTPELKVKDLFAEVFSLEKQE